MVNSAKRYPFSPNRHSESLLMRFLVVLAVPLVVLGSSAPSRAQDLAAAEAAKRAALMATLPKDAAKRVFGGIATPSAGRNTGRSPCCEHEPGRLEGAFGDAAKIFPVDVSDRHRA